LFNVLYSAVSYKQPIGDMATLIVRNWTFTGCLFEYWLGTIA